MVLARDQQKEPVVFDRYRVFCQTKQLGNLSDHDLPRFRSVNRYLRRLINAREGRSNGVLSAESVCATTDAILHSKSPGRKAGDRTVVAVGGP